MTQASEDICLAGMRDGVCWAVRRALTLDSKTEIEWDRRNLVPTLITWEAAIKAASPGFKKSIRMMRDDVILKGR